MGAGHLTLFIRQCLMSDSYLNLWILALLKQLFTVFEDTLSHELTKIHMASRLLIFGTVSPTSMYLSWRLATFV